MFSTRVGFSEVKDSKTTGPFPIKSYTNKFLETWRILIFYFINRFRQLKGILAQCSHFGSILLYYYYNYSRGMAYIFFTNIFMKKTLSLTRQCQLGYYLAL